MNYAIAVNDNSTTGGAFQDAAGSGAYPVIIELLKKTEGLNKLIELKYKDRDIFFYVNDLRFNNVDGANILNRVKKEKNSGFVVLTSEHFNSCIPHSREIGVSCWFSDSTDLKK